MREADTHYFTGQIVEEEVQLTSVELCRASGASVEELHAWVGEGVLAPQGEMPTQWRFGGVSLQRARLASRLTHDLGLNAPGVALALDLLEQIERLRAGRR